MNAKGFFETLAIAALTIGAAQAGAEVYKWVDQEGKTHYSDRPVSDNAEAVDIESRPTDPQRISEMKRARAESLASARESAEQAALEAERQAEEDANYAENCRRAREALAGLQSAQRYYVQGADGERRYLDESELATRRERAQGDVDKWCTERG